MLVAERGAGDGFEPVGVISIKVDGLGGGIVLDGVLKLLGGHRPRTGSYRLHGYLAIVLHGGIAAAGALGGDDDHAVGAAGAVDGGCGAVLEHVHRFHLLEVDAADVGVNHTVDDDERSLACGEGVGASEQELERCLRVSSVRIDHGKACHLALEHAACIGVSTHVQIFCLEAGDGTGYLFLGGFAVADDHGLIQHHGCRCGEHCIQHVRCAHREGEVVVAEECEGEGVAAGCRDGVAAVVVGNRPGAAGIVEHRCSGEHFAVVAGDAAADIFCLSQRSGCCGQQQAECGKELDQFFHMLGFILFRFW